MANDVGEIRRILNSFLMMIEQDESDSVIVAATNHEEILDEALFRRFDDVVEYHVPSAEEVQALLCMKLSKYIRTPKKIVDLSSNAVGLSHAEIARAVDDAIKEAIIHDESSISTDLLSSLLSQRQAIRRRNSINKE